MPAQAQIGACSERKMSRLAIKDRFSGILEKFGIAIGNARGHRNPVAGKYFLAAHLQRDEAIPNLKGDAVQPCKFVRGIGYQRGIGTKSGLIIGAIILNSLPDALKSKAKRARRICGQGKRVSI